MIPEAAVEAAAKWMHDNDCRSALHSGFPADFECYDWLDEARELLEAAAPHMLRDASADVAAAFANAESAKRALVARAAGVDPEVARSLGYGSAK